VKLVRPVFSVLAFLFVFAAFTAEAHAQPTDAQIKRDISSPMTISVTLGGPGKREWSSGFKKYVWSRSFTAKNRTDDPKVNIIIRGSASYDIVGGRYTFWRTFISSNEYEGIPNPTAADVDALIEKFGLSKFMGSARYNSVIGKVESIGLSEEPNFVWNNPNSVSFNVVTVYRERINDIGGSERISQVFEIRLYRNSLDAEWHNMISSARDRTVL
jgi:hypothetical protein